MKEVIEFYVVGELKEIFLCFKESGGKKLNR